MTIDEKYMARCIQLAKNGKCSTSPNPMVGAIIVCDDKIIGEGYHIKCGQPHAEVNAINSVKDESLLEKSTIYVSLEPCSHYGKTPPCADLIISKRIPKVVVGCKDPFPLVAGRGIKKLIDAGIEVKCGVLEEECIRLNKKFILFNTKKRPYIILKWAQSANGFIDAKRVDGEPVRISTEMTKMLVHKYRTENMAIMVGRNTALLDNPSLTARDWYGKSPVRVVLDQHLSLPQKLNLFDRAIRTIVINGKEEKEDGNISYRKVDYSIDTIPQILNILYKEKLESVIVEGGKCLIESFIEYNMWDEAFVEISDIIIDNGIKAPELNKYTSLESRESFFRDILHYTNY